MNVFKKVKFMMKISNNVEGSSKNLLKLISDDVKANKNKKK